MSQRPVPFKSPSAVRATPRASVAAQRPPWPSSGVAGLPASMAALPGSSAIVGTGPPLFASAPSFGSAPIRLLVSPQEKSRGKIRLNPPETIVPGETARQLGDALPEPLLLLAMIELRSVALPAATARPPPSPPEAPLLTTVAL